MTMSLTSHKETKFSLYFKSRRSFTYFLSSSALKLCFIAETQTTLVSDISQYVEYLDPYCVLWFLLLASTLLQDTVVIQGQMRAYTLCGEKPDIKHTRKCQMQQPVSETQYKFRISPTVEVTNYLLLLWAGPSFILTS